MAFKSSYHLQSCRLPKLDAQGASVGAHNYKWRSSPPTTYSHVGYPKWTDGDHPPNDHTIIREGGGDSKKAEEFQGMARNKLKQSNTALRTSPEN